MIPGMSPFFRDVAKPGADLALSACQEYLFCHCIIIYESQVLGQLENCAGSLSDVLAE